ncbi:MAG: ABC transporter substrate-binding protein [Sphingomonadales bacterium]|nr:ABC transporter substrate-binding protein [Sphingomonadales bacterium]
MIKHNHVWAAALILVWSAGAAAQSNAPYPSAADDPDAALVFIMELSNDAFDVLNDTNLTQDERDDAFRGLMRRGFDVNYIARIVLRRHYKTAQQDQREAYKALFPEYIIRLYSDRLINFGDEQLEVSGTQPSSGKRDIYVRSRLIRPEGEPVAADWRVRRSRKTGELKIVDLKIEGVSMIKTQYDEFNAIISKSGFDGLLDELRSVTEPESAVAEGPEAPSGPSAENTDQN